MADLTLQFQQDDPLENNEYVVDGGSFQTLGAEVEILLKDLDEKVDEKDDEIAIVVPLSNAFKTKLSKILKSIII
jgi:hypothetical protein